MTAGMAPSEFWVATTAEVLLYLRAYRRRMEDWDDLLVNLALNTVATPMKTKKKPAVKKMRLYERDEQGAQESSRKQDPEAWLEALKKRGGDP